MNIKPRFSTKMISLTKTVPDGWDGLAPRTAEELIIYCGRVSNPNNQLSFETAPKLVKYMVTHKHWSPFEMADMCVEVKTSRAISAQILRHWTFSFQEFSTRYAEVEPEAIVYPARSQDPKNRQASIDNLSDEVKTEFERMQLDGFQRAFDDYRKALDMGIAKEQARFLLPLATPTTVYMKANIRDWIHYLALRSGNGTQLEHAEIAIDILERHFKPNFPSISEAMGW
jgi:thymidylate synthase (FAD)